MRLRFGRTHFGHFLSSNFGQISIIKHYIQINLSGTIILDLRHNVTYVNLTKVAFVRKLRPRQIHKIDPRPCPTPSAAPSFRVRRKSSRCR
jgi:hypothetical protein